MPAYGGAHDYCCLHARAPAWACPRAAPSTGSTPRAARSKQLGCSAPAQQYAATNQAPLLQQATPHVRGPSIVGAAAATAGVLFDCPRPLLHAALPRRSECIECMPLTRLSRLTVQARCGMSTYCLGRGAACWGWRCSRRPLRSVRLAPCAFVIARVRSRPAVTPEDASATSAPTGRQPPEKVNAMCVITVGGRGEHPAAHSADFARGRSCSDQMERTMRPGAGAARVLPPLASAAASARFDATAAGETRAPRGRRRGAARGHHPRGGETSAALNTRPPAQLGRERTHKWTPRAAASACRGAPNPPD